jgi:hypothetical protein
VSVISSILSAKCFYAYSVPYNHTGNDLSHTHSACPNRPYLVLSSDRSYRVLLANSAIQRRAIREVERYFAQVDIHGTYRHLYADFSSESWIVSRPTQDN